MLKLAVRRVEACVAVAVLAQDEERRGAGKVASLGDEAHHVIYDLCSEEYPELTGDVLYVCGAKKDLDDLVAMYSFSTSGDAEQAVSDIRKLVRKYNDMDANQGHPAESHYIAAGFDIVK